MFSKLAVQNVKKSLRDYAVYFLTLTFGVCLFYVFNSMDSQQAMLDLSANKADILQTTTKLLEYISGFVAVVLGFLIVYANRFLIRRRKKELGVYMLLGMEKGKISRVLMLETLLIGIFALVVGLLIGVFASQAFSVLTGYLFEVNVTSFHFTFSVSAFWKTIVYFGVIFLIVMLFNAISVSRVKLIDLLAAARKNEVLPVRRTGITIVAFLLSIAFLGVAYGRILRDGLLMLDSNLMVTILLGCIGTVLFFFSLSGFLLRVLKANKKLYYKDLNMFVLRQINSRVNTAFLSMSIICLMLFFTICIFSGGMGLANTMSGNLSLCTPFDLSVVVVKPHNGSVENPDVLKTYQKHGLDLNQYAQSVGQLTMYQTEVSYGNLLSGRMDTLAKFKMDPGNSHIEETSFSAVSLSEFNQSMQQQGGEPISLSGDAYALVVNVDSLRSDYDKALEQGNTISIGGQALHPAFAKTLNVSIRTDFNAQETGLLVLPDAAVSALEPQIFLLNLQLRPEADPSALETGLKSAAEQWQEAIDTRFTYLAIFRQSVYDNAIGIKVEMSYIAIYIGIIFLIAGAAVLALQQLSEASDNVERYSLLRKLGTDDPMIHKALFRQIAIYFFIPLALALIHSVVGIIVINKAVSMVGELNILGNTLFTALLLLLVYGGYFLATYFGSRSMIRQRKT